MYHVPWYHVQNVYFVISIIFRAFREQVIKRERGTFMPASSATTPTPGLAASRYTWRPPIRGSTTSSATYASATNWKGSARFPDQAKILRGGEHQWFQKWRRGQRQVCPKEDVSLRTKWRKRRKEGKSANCAILWQRSRVAFWTTWWPTMWPTVWGSVGNLRSV